MSPMTFKSSALLLNLHMICMKSSSPKIVLDMHKNYLAPENIPEGLSGAQCPVQLPFSLTAPSAEP